jgi:hypothetical protein
MALIPCPECGLPRAAEDVEASACPVCGHRPPEPELLTAAEPVEQAPTPPVEPPTPPPARTRSGLLPGVAFVAGLGVVAAGALWFANSNRPADAPPPPAPEVAAGPAQPPPLEILATPPRVVPVVAPPKAKPPAPAVAAVPPSPPRSELAPAPRTAPPPVAIAPPPRLAPAPADGEVIRVDQPNGDYKLDRLADGKKVRLVGQAKRLVVAGLDGGAVLDATGLIVQDVHFTGPVAGGSTARVRADGAGGVFFAAAVTGRSRVAVQAGFVGFVDVARGRGSEVAGGSRVEVTARGVYLGGPVTGPDTRADVTLTHGGVLWFEELDAGATLRYRAAAGAGPPEVLHRGAVRGGAVVERVQ